MICVCVNSVSVYPSCVALKTGEWYHDVYAVACPADADCRDVRWYSSNTSVATVNATTGFIYARSAGTTRVYAEATDGSGCKDYITVTVTSGTIKVSSVGLNRSYVSIEEGESVTLHATVCPVNASNKTLCWSSSNTNVAVVDSSGTVTAKSRGRATITATAQDGSGVHDCCDINVTGDILVSSVSVSPSCKTVTIGSSFYLHETVCPTNATNKCVTWSSSNTSVATVNSSGLVLAKGAGNATITAAAADGSGKKGNCIVTVNAPIRVESVEVCPATKTMNVGETACLSAIVCPYNAANRSVIWCSSDEDVATVGTYTGMVRAKNAGTVTITATMVDGGHSDCCKISVDGREKVTISKDGLFFNIQFANGLLWKSIGYDLSDTSFPIPQNVWDRYNYNDTKSFSEKQLAFLYLFDPLGVEYYVKCYASHHIIDDIDLLFFKDHIYEEIFGVKPKFFRILSNEKIVYFDNYDPVPRDFRYRVYSDAEVLFGSHVIWDCLAITQVLSSVLYNIFGNVAIAVDVYKAMFFSGSIVGALSSAASVYLSDYMEENKIPGAKIFGWAGTLFGILGDVSDILYPPNINDIEIYKKVDSQNYQTYFVVEGSEMSMEEIIARCVVD